MKSLSKILIGTSSALVFSVSQGSLLMAQSLRNGVDSARGIDQPSGLFIQGGIFQEIVNILLFLIGAIAVVMIVIGGLRYVLSGGNAANVTAAKNTILYAVVGIVVAVLAYAAVDFVVSTLTSGGTAGL